MKTVRHWSFERKGRVIRLRPAGNTKGIAVPFANVPDAKKVFASLSRVCTDAAPELELGEVLQTAVDGMNDVFASAYTQVAVQKEAPLGCVHGRPQGGLCPWCTGLNG